ncbi:hypothetical protein MRX96_028848 [Rhipicephalus microplus]
MNNIDMPPTWIDLLQRLYSNNMGNCYFWPDQYGASVGSPSLHRCFGVRLRDTVAVSSVDCPCFSRLFLSGSSETVAEFGDPHVEQCVAVSGSRSCSCVADNSGVVQQNNRRPLQRG